MTHEAYCAQWLRLRENEVFVSIGDAELERFLNPSFERDRKLGATMGLPDLLSKYQREQETFFRIREVKFKLEQRLVVKALTQLKSGIRQLNLVLDAPQIDRVEIVVPLHGRKIKKNELAFLGEEISPGRFELNWKNGFADWELEFSFCPVTILAI